LEVLDHLSAEPSTEQVWMRLVEVLEFEVERRIDDNRIELSSLLFSRLRFGTFRTRSRCFQLRAEPLLKIDSNLTECTSVPDVYLAHQSREFENVALRSAAEALKDSPIKIR